MNKNLFTLWLQRLLELVTFGLLRSPLPDRIFATLKYELDRNVARLGSSVFSPNKVRLSLSAADSRRFAAVRAAFLKEIADTVQGRAAEKGWTLLGDAVQVELTPDSAIADDNFRIDLEIVEETIVPAVAPANTGVASSVDADTDPMRGGGRAPRRTADKTVALRAGDDGRTAPVLAMFQVLTGPCGDFAPMMATRTAVLGRGSEADLKLDADPAVSRRHAKLRIEPDGVRVEDLESSTGLLVNGMPVRAALMKPGDTLDIGDTQLELVHALGSPRC